MSFPVDLGKHDSQRFAAWCSGGLSGLHFANINKTLIKKQTVQKSTKPRHCTKLLLGTAVIVFSCRTYFFKLVLCLFLELKTVVICFLKFQVCIV
jgi:hypothetical protein